MDEMIINILDCVRDFMIENNISCEESVFQNEKVEVNALEFIAELYKLISPTIPNDEI